MSGERVLVYRCGAIGDTVVSLPAIHAVREAYRGARFILMTAGGGDGIVWTDEVLREFNWFDSYVTYNPSEIKSIRGLWGLVRRVRQTRASLVVYLSSDKNSALKVMRDRLFFLLAGVKRFIPCPSKKVKPWGRLRRSPEIYPYEVDRLLGGLRHYGIGTPSISFDLPTTERQTSRISRLHEEARVDASRPLVGMCPGSKQQAKRWPTERYADLGQRIIREGDVNIAIVGGPIEAEVGRQLAREWPRGRWINLAGHLTILESAALLKRCLFYVGNDTGAMHLAAAVGIRCVAIFSAREPARSWHPYGQNHIVFRRNVPCQNCYLSTCLDHGLRCLREISVDEVWSACQRMLVYR